MNALTQLESLEQLISERGFTLSKETCTSASGKQLPMFRIRHQNSSDWEGVWMPVLEHSASAPQTLLSLTLEALTKWTNFNYPKEGPPKKKQISKHEKIQ